MIQIAVALGAVLAMTLGGWAIHATGAKTGFDKRDLQCKAEISAINDRLIEAERQGNAQKEKARILGDRIRDLVSANEVKIKTLKGRLDNEVAKVSRLNRAFDERLTRMLNELSTVRSSSSGGGDAAPASNTDGKNAAVETDTAGSTGKGTSIGAATEALAECRTLYPICTSKLHGLQDYVASQLKKMKEKM